MTPGSRRTFIKRVLYAVSGVILQYFPWFSLVRSAAAKLKRQILREDTPMASLINKNPRYLDTRNMKPIPLNQFGTMGLSDHVFQPGPWRLEVGGQVGTPLSLSLPDIFKLPAVEKDVLLICPGVFANFGCWKGITVAQLLKLAQTRDDVTHVTIHGPDQKSARFAISDIDADGLILAYEINGDALPRKHGSPLRVVAEGYFGFDWIKFVHRIEVEKAKTRTLMEIFSAIVPSGHQ